MTSTNDKCFLVSFYVHRDMYKVHTCIHDSITYVVTRTKCVQLYEYMLACPCYFQASERGRIRNDDNTSRLAVHGRMPAYLSDIRTCEGDEICDDATKCLGHESWCFAKAYTHMHSALCTVALQSQYDSLVVQQHALGRKLGSREVHSSMSAPPLCKSSNLHEF